MKFLINGTNLKEGGGLQVAQSVIEQLGRFSNHSFVVVLSSFINDTNITYKENVIVYKYNIQHSFRTVCLGRDNFLDNLVEDKKIDAVLTIFGPSLWRPRCPHLCGFARAQLLLKASPYFDRISIKERIIFKIWDWLFKRSSVLFYTENPQISDLLIKHYKNTEAYTVTNYYNQIFDNPEKWKRSSKLPSFNGTTCLSVSSYSNHKNFEIIEGIIKYLNIKYPYFQVRFVMTFDEKEINLPESIKKKVLLIGKKDISEVPYLYEQSDIMFMPTLLECFTATYPEAMRMRKPIVTTDLDFAHGLCKDAACYYEAIDASAAAEAIYKVSTDASYANQLIENGVNRLHEFDNYIQRADKLIHILESISNK